VLAAAAVAVAERQAPGERHAVSKWAVLRACILQAAAVCLCFCLGCC
jgi:hypothetical protein